MSYTELHTGKLKIVRTEMSLEEFKQFYEVNQDILSLFIEDFEEKIEYEHTFYEIRQGDWRGDLMYVYNNGTLYEVLEYINLGEADYINNTVKTENIINFTYLFYNGGTCFSEMLEEGLNSIE